MHFTIIANGTFLPTNIILEAIAGKKTVSLDGATNKLAELGITPDIILGDFDSIDPQYLQNTAATIIHTPDQNFTDLIKGIRYCDEQGAKSITIICATGARMDHHEACIRALRKEHNADRPMFLHTELQTLRFARDEKVILKGEIGDKCGILAYPAGVLTSQGLEYDVTDYELIFAETDSTCNALRQTEASLLITGEALIVMPPLLKTQR